jgi:foldase protein PrsA
MSKAPRALAALVALTISTMLVACNSGGAIATVNGQAVSRADFDAKLEANPVARQVLQQQVQEVLLDQYAAKNNIVPSDADIKAKEDAIKATFPGQPWDQVLKARGLTEADVQQALRSQLIVEKAVGKNVTVSEAQIKAYFEKNHAQFDTPEKVQARHILVDDLATANKVEALLKAGGNFAALAAQYSKDPGSKDSGGELGFFGHGQMLKPFDQAAFSLPIGKISAPVHSAYGYHIIEVEARQPAVRATLANTHDKIAEMLRQQQESPLVAPFLSSLMAQANVQVNDPRFAGLFPSPAPSIPPAAPATTTAPAVASPAPAATK